MSLAMAPGLQDPGKETAIILSFKEKLDHQGILELLHKQNRKLFGLISPDILLKETRKVYYPYYLAEIDYAYKHEQGKVYLFQDCITGLKKGIFQISNIEFEPLPAENLPLLKPDFTVNETKKTLLSYVKLDLLAKSYRKFIDWNVSIAGFQLVYRPYVTVKYVKNGRDNRAYSIFTDNFLL